MKYLNKKSILGLIAAAIVALGYLSGALEKLPDFDFAPAVAPAPAADAGAQ
jgi:hypothetical protein